MKRLWLLKPALKSYNAVGNTRILNQPTEVHLCSFQLFIDATKIQQASFRVIAWRIWSKPFYSTDSRAVGNSINTTVFVLLYSASSSNPDVKHYLGINENFQSKAYWCRTQAGLPNWKVEIFLSYQPQSRTYRLDYTTHSTHTHMPMQHMPWSPWKMAVRTRCRPPTTPACKWWKAGRGLGTRLLISYMRHSQRLILYQCYHRPYIQQFIRKYCTRAIHVLGILYELEYAQLPH